MWLRAPGVVRGAARPWSRASFYSNIIVCKRVRVQACASVCTDAPPPGRRRGAGPRRPAPAPLRAASRVNKREPAARRGPGGRGAARRGRRKLGGAPAHPPGSGKGRGRAGSERGWAPGLAAGRPASAGLGRLSGGTSRPPSRRPAPGLALGLCHCARPGARGALAPRLGVICPGCGLAPGASGPGRRAPGRPPALGLTRLGYGAGEVGAGSLRGPGGAQLARSGARVPLGP